MTTHRERDGLAADLEEAREQIEQLQRDLKTTGKERKSAQARLVSSDEQSSFAMVVVLVSRGFPAFSDLWVRGAERPNPNPNPNRAGGREA